MAPSLSHFSTPPQPLVSTPSTPTYAEKRAQDQVDLSPPQQPVVSHPPKCARLTFIPVKQNRTMSQAARPQSGAPGSDDDAMDHGVCIYLAFISATSYTCVLGYRYSQMARGITKQPNPQ